MNRSVILALSLMSLMAACTPAREQQAKSAPAKEVAATNAGQCQAQATNRLALFDKPSTYPISADEKRNAYSALYNECMKTYDVQAASPKPNFDLAQANNAAVLANLSPAAGGNAPAKSSVTTLPNGVVVIDTAQFANLSPAAGGRVAGVTNGMSGNGSTVVVVQAAPSTSISYPPPPTQAAAIPVTPTASVQDTAEATPEPATAAYKSNPKNSDTDAAPKRKIARAKAKPVEQDSGKAASYKTSRFERNAVPVNINLTRKSSDLDALQPSAGTTLEKALFTDRPEPKD